MCDSVSDAGIKNKSNSQSSYNINNKKTYTGKSYDPYDVGEYDDPDDFADEWQKNLETVIMMMHTITGKMKWNKN